MKSYRKCLILVQKAHFKSGNVQKLDAAIKVYAGLLEVEAVREDVKSKLLSMLLHPYSKVSECDHAGIRLQADG